MKLQRAAAASRHQAPAWTGHGVGPGGGHLEGGTALEATVGPSLCVHGGDTCCVLGDHLLPVFPQSNSYFWGPAVCLGMGQGADLSAAWVVVRAQSGVRGLDPQLPLSVVRPCTAPVVMVCDLGVLVDLRCWHVGGA